MNPPTQRNGLALSSFRLAPKGKKINCKPLVKNTSGIHTHQCNELASYVLDKLAEPSLAD